MPPYPPQPAASSEQQIRGMPPFPPPPNVNRIRPQSRPTTSALRTASARSVKTVTCSRTCSDAPRPPSPCPACHLRTQSCPPPHPAPRTASARSVATVTCSSTCSETPPPPPSSPCPAYRFCQVGCDRDLLQHLLRDGVGAVELQHDVGVEDVLHGEDAVLGVFLGQPHRLAGLEDLAQGSQLPAGGGDGWGWLEVVIGSWRGAGLEDLAQGARGGGM